MNRTIGLLLAATIAASVPAASHGQPAASPATRPASKVPVDLAPIAGDYAMVSASRNGQPAPPHMADGMRVSIRGTTISIVVAGRSDDATVTAHDPAAKPATLDMTSAIGSTVRGIYKVEGDTLTLCFARGDDRPTSFEPGKDISLLVLKRDAGVATRPRVDDD